MGGVRTNLPRGETYLPLLPKQSSGLPNFKIVMKAMRRISGALARPQEGR